MEGILYAAIEAVALASTTGVWRYLCLDIYHMLQFYIDPDASIMPHILVN